MAQRNNPIRRVPGNPLAGIVRALNQQSRYAQRRRNGAPTVTSGYSGGPDASNTADGSASEGGNDETMALMAQQMSAPGLSQPATVPEPPIESAQVRAAMQSATDDATQVAMVDTDESGVAKVAFGPFRAPPVVTVTAMCNGPVLPVIEDVSTEGASVVAYDVTTGGRVAGVTLHVQASSGAWSNPVS